MRSFIKNLFIFLCVLLVFPHSGIANTYDSIKYNLDLSNIKNLVLTVEMTLKGKFEDKIVLIWPSLYLTEQFKYIKIFPKYKIDFIRENDDVRAIVTVPNHSKDQIKITYEVHQKRGNPSDIGEAVIRDTLVHAQGMKLFIVLPEDLHVNKKIKVAINWLNIHQGWKMISPYGTRSQMRLNTTVYDLWSSFYVAGTVRMYKMGEDAHPVWVALYGNFDIKDRKIISDLSQIIHSQRTFFNDFECPYYATSLIEGDNPHVNGGIGYRNGFSAFFPKGMSEMDYYALFAHEHLHRWIHGDINDIKKGSKPELKYWWSEGFTDFYSRVIALRSKGIDRNTFIKHINEILYAYYFSPSNLEPNSRMAKNLQKGDDMGKLPYRRGLVFAIYLNDMIQKENNAYSLDHVLHDLIQVMSKVSFSPLLFKEIVHKYIKKGIDHEMTHFIDKGNLILLDGISLPIEKIPMGRYYLGFNQDIALKDKQIKDIDVNRNAYKAGLRNGQKITGGKLPCSCRHPDQIITVTTPKGTVHFKPEHDKNKVDIYQIKKNLSSEEEQQFNQFFGVE